MQISYRKNKVKKQCTDLRQAKKDFPQKIAIKLLKLINFIEAADNLESVVNNPVYHFHDLKGDKKDIYALDIDGRRSPYRLLVTFEEDEIGKVFTDSISIEAIIVEEVSKHYE